VIFVTVGTHYDGFPRLLRAVAALPARDLVVQFGHGSPPRNATVAKSFMRFDEMVAHFRAADAVITHAGVGSIIVAIRHGHVPVIMPRLRRYGEHVDDHQVDLARRLEGDGRALVAWEGSGLGQLLAKTPPRAAVSAAPTTGVHHALRQELMSAVRQCGHGSGWADDLR
jgi:beta-1,4-N-acetylglucosaminyltransferase